MLMYIDISLSGILFGLVWTLKLCFMLAINQLKRQKRMFFVEMFAYTTKSQYLCIVKRLIDCLG